MLRQHLIILKSLCNTGFATLELPHLSSRRALHCCGILSQVEKFVSSSISTPEEFQPKRCLLVQKITRYEYEKKLLPNESEDGLRKAITKKGSNYKELVARHDEYNRVLESVHTNLVCRGLDVRLIDRQSYDESCSSWADVVISVGGDGTFLLAASKVRQQSIPVIGINADPERSEGYLCLPRHFSLKHQEAIDRILSGKFSWKLRQRIRLTMSGLHSEETPRNLHDQPRVSTKHRYSEGGKEPDACGHETANSSSAQWTLPELALNDVFIGESLSARVSFYEISVDGSERVKQKSSGLTVCTGTGSSSWYFNINHIPKQSVRQILDIANKLGNCKVDLDDELKIRQVTKMFNNSLLYDPSEAKMAYVIRDPIVNGVFSVNNQRGFCDEISVKSRMWDGCVVVDGGAAYRFNDGTVLTLQMLKEDALRGLQLGLEGSNVPR